MKGINTKEITRWKIYPDSFGFVSDTVYWAEFSRGTVYRRMLPDKTLYYQFFLDNPEEVEGVKNAFKEQVSYSEFGFHGENYIRVYRLDIFNAVLELLKLEIKWQIQ